jgi:hypothetical protein
LLARDVISLPLVESVNSTNLSMFSGPTPPPLFPLPSEKKTICISMLGLKTG